MSGAPRWVAGLSALRPAFQTFRWASPLPEERNRYVQFVGEPRASLRSPILALRVKVAVPFLLFTQNFNRP